MKKNFLFMVVTMFSCIGLNAKNIVLEFSVEDFQFIYDMKERLFVTSNNLEAFYSEDTGYALPSFIYEMELEGMQLPYVDINDYPSSTLLYPSITVAPKPSISCVGEWYENQEIIDSINPMGTSITPEICKVVGYSHLPNGNTKVNLIVSPFLYGADRSLKLLTHINMEVSGTIYSKRAIDNFNKGKLAEYKSLLNNYLSSSLSINKINATNGIKNFSKPFRPNASSWKYVILTSTELYDSFMKLAEWKDLKGVPGLVLNVDELLEEASMMEDTSEEILKWYIMALNDSFSTEYVLLGGDETIIPVKRCYGLVKEKDGKSTSDIPTDLFYSCFGGSFNWDGNNNGICGELEDNIDLYSSLYVTRVPVRTKADADAFVSKLLKYEQNPRINNAMLMCGRALDSSAFSSPSDADYKGRNLLSNHISKVWDGEITRLYDTSTSFSGNAEYQFNVTHFSDEIEKGYSFLDMITAGDYYYWSFEGEPFMFLHAQSQKNMGSTFVISASNNCNAFEKNESNIDISQSISEFLINNPNNGVIGFFGSSRENWEYIGYSDLGPNLKYNAWFYRYLFSSVDEEKNYGRIVNSVKSTMATIAYDGYGAYRWLQFALNPIGDPETPVFINTPKRFSNAYFQRSENGKLQIYSGENYCRFCVKSLEDYGRSCYDVFFNISSLSDCDMYRETSVCITKPNFVPCQFIIYNFQNQTIRDRVLNGDLVRIGSNILHKINNGKVYFQGSVKISSPLVEIYDNMEVPLGSRLEITY